MEQELLKKLVLEKTSRKIFFSDKSRYIQSILLIYSGIVAGLLILISVKESSYYLLIPCFIFCFLIIGWSQYALGIVMHEGIHSSLPMNSKKWLWFFSAYPIYKNHVDIAKHLSHHKYLGSEQDPDYQMYQDFPRSKAEFIRRNLYFGLGLNLVARLTFKGQALRLRFAYNQPKSISTKKIFRDNIYIISVQFLITATFILIYKNLLYFVLFWMLPYLTINPLLSSIRFLCEHGSPSGWVIRSFAGPCWSTRILAPFNFGYHFEHHSIPSVPHHQLSNINKRLTIKCIGVFNDGDPDWNSHVIYRNGHLQFLRLLYKSLP